MFLCEKCKSEVKNIFAISFSFYVFNQRSSSLHLLQKFLNERNFFQFA